MSRVMADCRRFESDNNCSLTIIGDESEVVPVAIQHAIDAHGHEDSPELRDGISKTLEPAEEYNPGERQPEPFPG